MKVKECIFCGASPVSNEHIWSKWMQSLFPDVLTNFHAVHEISESALDGEVKTVWGVLSGGGGNISQTYKAVCKACNNGWMSDIDDGAKEPFSALFKINSDTISARDAMAIKSWLFLKFCLHLHISPGHPLRAEDRNTFRIAVDCFLKDFYSTKSMPVDFHLYLGRAPATGRAFTFNLINQGTVFKNGVGIPKPGQVVPLATIAYVAGNMIAVLTSSDHMCREIDSAFRAPGNRHFFALVGKGPSNFFLSNFNAIGYRKFEAWFNQKVELITLAQTGVFRPLRSFL